MIRALLAASLLLGSAHAARTHVVAIGNDRGRADEVPLRYAERDAQAMAAIMRRLGGVNPQDLVVVNGGSANDVRRTLLEVNTRIRPHSAQSALIVYYSGHADAGGLHLGETTLPYDELKNIVAGSAAAVRVLILDGCRSGGLTRVKGVQATGSFSIKLEDSLDIEGLAVMTSSTAGEDSHESERLQGSFFTHHLLAALMGAGDHDQDGRVTLTEAYSYAYQETLRSSERTPTLQHPTYAYDIKGKGDLVLTRLDSGIGTGWLRSARAATYLVRARDEDGPVYTVANVDAGNVRVAVPAGDYFVQERHPDHYREYSVSVAPSKEVRLADRPYRTVAYAQLVRKGARKRVHGMYVLGTVQGAFLEGWAPLPGAALGYAIDFPWATFSLRGRFERTSRHFAAGESTLSVFGAGVTAERVIDWPWGSLAFGILGEGLRFEQSLALSGGAEQRGSWGAAFGGLGALEVPVGGGLAMRLEGGPITRIFSRAETGNGTQIGTAATSRFTWWSAAGIGVRF